MTSTPEQQRGRGRPPIGAPVRVRLPHDLVAWLDRQAAALGISRAAYVREVLEAERDRATAPAL
jgi:Ribbon-helix-helix protein, copG family